MNKHSGLQIDLFYFNIKKLKKLCNNLPNKKSTEFKICYQLATEIATEIALHIHDMTEPHCSKKLKIQTYTTVTIKPNVFDNKLFLFTISTKTEKSTSKQMYSQTQSVSHSKALLNFIKSQGDHIMYIG